MICSQTEKVSLLIDGELPPDAAATVKQHLQQCAECHKAHEVFLNLRQQLTAYDVAIDPAAANAALAEVLATSTRVTDQTKAAAAGWRDRLSAAVGLDRLSVFSPRFAAVAALVVLAFTIGIIGVLRYGPHVEVANKSAEQQSVTPTHQVTAPQDEIADNRKPKGPKVNGNDRQRPAPQTNKDSLKPTPAQKSEPNLPKAPRCRIVTPPNYSAIDATVAANDSPLRQAEVELLTARHLEQSELLLRAFRNVRTGEANHSPEIVYERKRAQQLLYQNMLIRREADVAGDVQLASLLGSLEPILLDIANLRNKPGNEEVTAIKDRVERKSLVPLLQINSNAVARANRQEF